MLTLIVLLIYFRDECEQRGGINDGGCAEGYGVCCTCKLVAGAMIRDVALFRGERATCKISLLAQVWHGLKC